MQGTSKLHHDGQQQIVTLLNQELALAIDLKLQAKQAHWNVKGASFIALHQLFDSLATIMDELADNLAERALQLGGVALGTLQEVAGRSSLKHYPATMQHQEGHLKTLVASLEHFSDSLYHAIDTATHEADPVTADLLTQAAALVDKQAWFLRAHIVAQPH